MTGIEMICLIFIERSFKYRFLKIIFGAAYKRIPIISKEFMIIIIKMNKMVKLVL